MGFKRQPRTYKLTFDDPELDGLEVRARSISIDEVNDDDLLLVDSFAGALISWNLEDEDGRPVPATPEGVKSYPDVDFISYLASTWLKAVSGVSDELGKDSSSGSAFPEASLPMETLSPSLAS